MTKLNLDQLTDLYSLLSVEGIGPGKIRNLLSKFRSTNRILSANYNSLIEVEGISINLAHRIQKINHQRLKIIDSVEEELEKLGKLGGRIVTVWDEEFPSLLKKIFDPPLMLQIKGEILKERWLFNCHGWNKAAHKLWENTGGKICSRSYTAKYYYSKRHGTRY